MVQGCTLGRDGEADALALLGNARGGLLGNLGRGGRLSALVGILGLCSTRLAQACTLTTHA